MRNKDKYRAMWGEPEQAESIAYNIGLTAINVVASRYYTYMYMYLIVTIIGGYLI